MKFRYARHTNDLQPIIAFYTQVIGLSVLGDFKNHANYDGVFLGFPNEKWHLEFTVSNQLANHHFDEDDLLVFFMETQNEMDTIISKVKASSTKIKEPKNPYWKTNGVLLIDPDGVGVIVSVRE